MMYIGWALSVCQVSEASESLLCLLDFYRVMLINQFNSIYSK